MLEPSLSAIKQQLANHAHTWQQPIENLRDEQVERATRTRSACVDEALKTLWAWAKLPEQFALVAVGGYGRGELFPHSDVDVLILVDGEPDETQTRMLERLMGASWDIGLELGSSVRTISQCIEEARNDITVQTALLESRQIVGNADAFGALQKQLQQHLDVKQFFTLKTLEQNQRHAKHQNTPYSLEPNCKESPGGLRDLQMLVWLAKAAGLASNWAEMARAGLISPFEAARLRSNERTLRAIRYQLHVLCKRREDRLVFDVQTQLAERFGFQATFQKRASEQLMQRYYLAAKSVLLLNTILLQNIEHRIFGKTTAANPIDSDFQETEGLLDVTHERVFIDNPANLLRCFLVWQKHPHIRGLSATLLRQLWRNRFRVNREFRNNPLHRQLFLEIFKQPQGILHALRRMNDTGILGRYLPVFRNIVGQMQHDLFHVYTVDQHILMVLRNLRRFTMTEHVHEYPLCSELIAHVAEPWLLYIAALFHDIAKGRGGDHSILGEVDARTFCIEHELSPEQTDLVAFLVQHHLLMSSIAQKQDISDPDVIAHFAHRVKTQNRLTALYLLTVADIRGTSPKVWNAWKGKLLEDLYRNTLRYLGGESADRNLFLLKTQQEARQLLHWHTVDDKVIDATWQLLEVSYFVRHNSDEVAWHTRHIAERLHCPQPLVKVRHSRAEQSLDVLVFTPDESDLFARICGFFNSKNLNILDAKIHTTQHGYAIDSFVIQHHDGTEFDRSSLSLLENELTLGLEQKTALMEPHLGRISRQSKHFPVRPAVKLHADDKGNHFILSVSATDRTGLLYSIARVLAKRNINVHTAKIITLGGRAEDTFLISHNSLQSHKTQIELESELLLAIA